MTEVNLSDTEEQRKTLIILQIILTPHPVTHHVHPQFLKGSWQIRTLTIWQILHEMQRKDHCFEMETV